MLKRIFVLKTLVISPSQIAQFINKITTLLIIFIGVNLVISGELTIGQLIAFNMLVGRGTGPTLKLVQLWQDFQQASISIKRLGIFLNAKPEEIGVSNRQQLATVKGDIAFNQVSFNMGYELPKSSKIYLLA